MTAPTRMDKLIAERAANRAAEAAQDAATLIASGRTAEAVDLLEESTRHAQTAAGKLRHPLED